VDLKLQLRVLVRLASALARLLAAEASARCLQTTDLPVAMVADSEVGRRQGCRKLQHALGSGTKSLKTPLLSKWRGVQVGLEGIFCDV
jgi:hypothetical protein